MSTNPASAVTQTQTWWRCDVLSGGLRNTAGGKRHASHAVACGLMRRYRIR